MDPYLVVTLGAIAFLLLLSAFFSGSETALTAASRPLFHHLDRSGNERAKLVNRLRRNRERLLGSILIGNNLVNILASVLATRVLIEITGEVGVIYATIVMTILIVIFSEVLPKTYAIIHADRMALTVAPAVRAIVALFSPLARAVAVLVRLIFRAFKIGTEAGPHGALIAEQELRGAIELHRGTDSEAQHEGVMLHSILDLGEVEVDEVMTHRSDVASVNADLPVEEIISEVVTSPYTRIPLWRDKPENIIGVLHAKALLKAVKDHAGGAQDLDVAGLATDPWFIPESTSLLAQLHAFRRRGEHFATPAEGMQLGQLHSFRRRGEHFALVVDEYGDLMGIVTLEDILEEIVGDISDEHDIPRRGIRPQSSGAVIVDGDVTIRDLNRRFDWQLPDEEAATVAGLVLHESRLIPEPGQVFTFFGFRFEILGRSGNRLTALGITPPDKEESVS
jgi:Mg2+/Co2+ transporter CorB